MCRSNRLHEFLDSFLNRNHIIRTNYNRTIIDVRTEQEVPDTLHEFNFVTTDSPELFLPKDHRNFKPDVWAERKVAGPPFLRHSRGEKVPLLTNVGEFLASRWGGGGGGGIRFRRVKFGFLPRTRINYDLLHGPG